MKLTTALTPGILDRNIDFMIDVFRNFPRRFLVTSFSTWLFWGLSCDFDGGTWWFVFWKIVHTLGVDWSAIRSGLLVLVACVLALALSVQV